MNIIIHKIKPRKVYVLFLLITFITITQGCAPSRYAVPENLISKVHYAGIPNARTDYSHYKPDIQDSLLECRNSSFLALSGGGANGAFGAGVLYGWSQVGTRPKFQIVTGVSTGALIAPFAFLGPEYDDKLKDAYTTVESRDIFNICGFTGIFQIFFGESFAQTKPLAGLIEKMFTEKELIGIAAEHAKGRRLYIGTTNLDTQQFVIWDMGAIASSENPEALKIFRKVLLASASIPGAFPPVYFDVETNGEKYSEIHVDGGVIAGVFGYGSLLFEDILKSKTGMNKARSIYVIMNNKIEAEYQQTQPNFLKIVDRSFMTLMKAQSWNDLSRIYNSAQKNNVDFNYIAIPDNYIFSKKRGFDKKEMNKLFELGCNLAKSGTFWNKSITIYPNPDL